MKLIVGLGNPGPKYKETRHNVGFDVVAMLADRAGAGKPRKKFQGLLDEVVIGAERTLLLRPETYMNLSGDSVQVVRGFYRIADEDILVVCDDFNLPLGQLRLRSSGSSGGQKGLGDIIKKLGTERISRLRLGIGTPPEGWVVADYVLSRFTPEEASTMRETVARAADAATDWLRQGIDYCMNQYNSRNA
ncbi:MAG: aminoacyl-tRNA hydrolase [Planctomycetales bacterium]|nr:aminoacyl-tRNA hydrolase [Planctomycetales bacterium]